MSHEQLINKVESRSEMRQSTLQNVGSMHSIVESTLINKGSLPSIEEKPMLQNRLKLDLNPNSRRSLDGKKMMQTNPFSQLGIFSSQGSKSELEYTPTIGKRLEAV